MAAQGGTFQVNSYISKSGAIFFIKSDNILYRIKALCKLKATMVGLEIINHPVDILSFLRELNKVRGTDYLEKCKVFAGMRRRVGAASDHVLSSSINRLCCQTHLRAV